MAELKKCWIVRNPSEDFEEECETAEDLIYETTAIGLVSLIIGTESVPGRWMKEHTKIHTDKASATADAEQRFAKFKR